jgi:hypothetical protein
MYMYDTGIGTAAKVLSKKGPHSLEIFAKTLHINTTGSFNVIRLGIYMYIYIYILD